MIVIISETGGVADIEYVKVKDTVNTCNRENLATVKNSQSTMSTVAKLRYSATTPIPKPQGDGKYCLLLREKSLKFGYVSLSFVLGAMASLSWARRWQEDKVQFEYKTDMQLVLW